MSSRGGGRRGGGRSDSGRGLRLIESTPSFVGQQPTPSDGNDHDQGNPRQSEEMSQTGSTASADNMYICRTESGDWEFANSKSTYRTISFMFKACITEFWPSFSKVPGNIKDHWFEELKVKTYAGPYNIHTFNILYYSWAPTTSFADVRRLWDSKCSLTYRWIVSNMKKYKKRNPCIINEVWQQFLAHWKREDVKELAQKKSIARNTNPRPHRCGSKSMAQWMNDMMKYNERVVQMTESQGREPSLDKLNLLFIQLTGEGETSTSSRSTRRPDAGNIPRIYRDNTYSARFQVSDDRGRLLEEVQELRTKNNELNSEMNKLQQNLRSVQENMSSMQEFFNELRHAQGQRTQPT